MSLKIYNTQTRSKEEFTPIHAGRVNMYVCGVTAYDLCHLGHARSAVAFDVIVRHLRRSYKVHFVRNITDIDDKIINRANELGVPWDQHAEKYIKEMNDDFKVLGILPPDTEPRATQHLAEMIAIIEKLLAHGLAYPSEGDVFFSVRKFAGYGSLSGKSIETLLSGARVGIDEKKEDPLDFALWKAAKPGEPSWPSPWGPGRPGWHIECSAMAQKYLGETLDIHGGGRDLIFPHHENECAQSQGSTGKPFVNYWLHNGFVTIDKAKMSKSTGNFFSIREVLRKYSPETVRLFLISSHYRGPIDYSEENLNEAQARIERIYQFKARVQRLSGQEGAPEDLQKEVELLPERVNESLNDDFNTPMALAAIFESVRKVNVHYDAHPHSSPELGQKAVRSIENAAQVLGIFQMKPETWLHRTLPSDEKSVALDKANIDRLINDRNQARADKNWQRADEIRKELEKESIVLEDTPQGTVWRQKI